MMVDESGREKSESMRDKRNEHDCGYDGADGGDNGGDDGHDDEDDDFDDDDKSMIDTGFRWEMASKYRWQMTMTNGMIVDGFCTV